MYKSSARITCTIAADTIVLASQLQHTCKRVKWYNCGEKYNQGQRISMRVRKKGERETDRERRRQTDTQAEIQITFLQDYQVVSEIQVSSSPVSTQVARLTDLSTHVKRLTGMRANSSPSKLTTIT